MTGSEIYLDNSATTQVDREVAEVACEMMMSTYGNPSSLHYMGAQAYHRLNIARSQVAQVLGAVTSRVFFTSGGTEGNNLALYGVMLNNTAPAKRNMVTTAIEHASVLETSARLEKCGFQVKRVMPRADGVIHAEDVAQAVDEHTVLVSTMTVNNETGEILPIGEITRQVRAKNPTAVVHTDFVQGFGKLPMKVWDLDIDILTLSGHKIHAPKGIGAIYIREGISLAPVQTGGKQEGGIRPGTESVPMAVALGTAAYRCLLEMERDAVHVGKLCRSLREQIEAIPCTIINSPTGASPYVLNFSLVGRRTDNMVSELSKRHIYLSGGSACSKGEPSHVLKAMKLPEERIDSALRVGLSHNTTQEELNTLVNVLQQLTE